MSPRRKSLQQEHGQTLTEHAGIGLVVVVLLLVVAGGITVASGDGIGQAIVCKIAQQIRSVAGGSYECPSSSNPYAANPAAVPSKVQETTKSTSAGVKLIKVTGDVSDGSSVRRTTYADGSGSRQYSKTIEGSVGYSFGTGHSKKKKKEKAVEKSGEKSGGGDKTEKKGDGDPFKISLEGSVKASGTITTTQTYKCDTPHHISCSEFDKQNRAATKERLRDQGIGRFKSGDKTIKQTPDTTSRAWTVKLSGDATVSAEVKEKKENTHKSKSKNEKSKKKEKKEKKNKKGKKNKRDEKNEKEEEEEEDDTTTMAKSDISISGEIGYTNTSTTNADGSTSRSHRFAYKSTIHAGDEIFGNEGGTDNSAFGSYEVTYDGDGKLKTVTFTGVQEGEASASKNKEHRKKGEGGSVTTTVTTTLDVSQLSPEDRAIAEHYVSSSSFINGMLKIPRSVFKPSRPSDDNFNNLLYRQAQTTRVVQNGKTVTQEGGWDLWLLKCKTESTTSTQDTISSQHLGRPGQDGERVYEDDTE